MLLGGARVWESIKEEPEIEDDLEFSSPRLSSRNTHDEVDPNTYSPNTMMRRGLNLGLNPNLNNLAEFELDTAQGLASRSASCVCVCVCVCVRLCDFVVFVCCVCMLCLYVVCIVFSCVMCYAMQHVEAKGAVPP